MRLCWNGPATAASSRAAGSFGSCSAPVKTEALIFRGIHFQFSNEDGRRAGRTIGTPIVNTKLQRVGGASPGKRLPMTE